METRLNKVSIILEYNDNESELAEIEQYAAMEVHMDITIAGLLYRMPKVTKGTHASNCQILIALMECLSLIHI